MKKIILDTDIGSDIDDAFCIAYLLKQRQCELLGITTVSGESDKRAMLASVLCKRAGRGDIPIYPGICTSFEGKLAQPVAQQAVKLSGHPHETEFKQYAVLDFMRETIRKNPHEITLLAIGPLTNAGALLAADPAIAEMLKEIVIMGGSFGTMPDYTEWNIFCDPYAAAAVFNSQATVKCVGCDITMQVKMTGSEFKERAVADILQPVSDFADEWLQNTDYIIYHDPLAGATIFDDTLCSFKRGKISVRLDGQKGITEFTQDENGRHFIAGSVDRDKFIKHYFDVVEQK